MKQKISRFAAVAIFILLVTVGLCRIYDILKWKDTNGGYLSTIDQLYNTDDDLMDLVFMGSSHCYCGIYPEILWEENGIAAFDMAVSAQDKASTYHQLKELLKTQHPKVVVVDIYGLSFEEHQVESNVYRNYLSMRLSRNSYEHVKEYVDKEKQQDYLARWPIVHTRYRELKAYDFLPYEPSIIGRGALFSWSSSAVEEDNGVNRCQEVEPLSETNLEWIQKMVRLSEEEDFHLIFMHIPWKRSDEIQAIINGFREYVDETGLDFIDLSLLTTELDIRSDTDWIDAEHLNARGAQKITRYLGQYVTDKYELPDHRGDERYHQWTEAADRYRQARELAALSGIANRYEFCLALAKIPRTTCILSLEGVYDDPDLGIYSCVSCFNMDREDFMRGGKWLYRDGQLTKLYENAPAEALILDLNEIDTLKINYNGDFNSENLFLNELPCGNTRSGLQVIVYDDIEKKLVTTKEFP